MLHFWMHQHAAAKSDPSCTPTRRSDAGRGGLPGLAELQSPGVMELGDVAASLKYRVHAVQAENARLRAEKAEHEASHGLEVKTLESMVAALESRLGVMQKDRYVLEVQMATQSTIAPGGGAEERAAMVARAKRLQEEVELLKRERDERAVGEQEALMQAKSSASQVASFRSEAEKASKRASEATEEARKLSVQLADVRREAELTAGNMSAEQEQRVVREHGEMMQGLEMAAVGARKLKAEARGREEVIRDLREALAASREREREVGTDGRVRLFLRPPHAPCRCRG